MQHLQPRCPEDRFLPQQDKEKEPAKAQSTSAHHFPPSGSPQTASHLTFPGTRDPFKDDRPELSSQAPRPRGNFSPIMPERLCTTTSRNKFQAARVIFICVVCAQSGALHVRALTAFVALPVCFLFSTFKPAPRTFSCTRSCETNLSPQRPPSKIPRGKKKAQLIIFEFQLA